MLLFQDSLPLWSVGAPSLSLRWSQGAGHGTVGLGEAAEAT